MESYTDKDILESYFPIAVHDAFLDPAMHCAIESGFDGFFDLCISRDSANQLHRENITITSADLADSCSSLNRFENQAFKDLFMYLDGEGFREILATLFVDYARKFGFKGYFRTALMGETLELSFSRSTTRYESHFHF